MAERKLKPGWRTWRFEQMAQIVNDRIDNPAEAGSEYYVGLEHLDSDSLKIRRWGKPTDVEATKLRFRKGDIIFGRRRAYQRKLAVAEFDGICSAHAMVLRSRPEVVLSEFLPFFMQSDGFMKRALEISVGSLSPTINWRTLAAQEFALPPLEDQRRSASLLSQQQHLLESLDKAHSDLSRLRRAFLSASWDTSKEVSIGTLIERKLIEAPQDGNHGEKHPTSRDYVAEGIPFIMAADLADGSLNLKTCKFLPKSKADGLRIGFSLPGDVLLSHKGTLGRVAIVPELRSKYVMLSPQTTYYRANGHGITQEWLYFTFQSPQFQQQMIQHGKQSTRNYVGITAQRLLRIPVPPLPIQKKHCARLQAQEQTKFHLRSRRTALLSLKSDLAFTEFQ